MIVVVLESEVLLVSEAINKCFETDINIEIIPIPDHSAMGTADSLRQIKDKIKVDIYLPKLRFEPALLRVNEWEHSTGWNPPPWILNSLLMD